MYILYSTHFLGQIKIILLLNEAEAFVRDKLLKNHKRNNIFRSNNKLNIVMNINSLEEF